VTLSARYLVRAAKRSLDAPHRPSRRVRWYIISYAGRFPRPRGDSRADWSPVGRSTAQLSGTLDWMVGMLIGAQLAARVVTAQEEPQTGRGPRDVRRTDHRPPPGGPGRRGGRHRRRRAVRHPDAARPAVGRGGRGGDARPDAEARSVTSVDSRPAAPARSRPGSRRGRASPSPAPTARRGAPR